MLRLALLVAVTLLTLELVLQIAAFVVWSSRSRPTAATSTADKTILCIGDSFTYGLGARDLDNAYPQSMARVLREQGEAIDVVNAGWPGSTSQDVLMRLPALLATHHPRLCYVLVGFNDYWSTDPGRDVNAGFPIEWRSKRMFDLIVHALTGGGDSSAPRDRSPASAPFLGTWHQGELWLRFGADGTIETPDGPMAHLFALRGDDQLVLVSRADRSEAVLEWRQEEQRLWVRGPLLFGELELRPGLPTGDAWLAGLAAEHAGNHEQAQQRYRQALALPRRSAAARAALVRVVHAMKRTAEARSFAEQLEAAYRATPNPVLGQLATDAWLILGEVDHAVELLGHRLSARPVDDRAILTLIQEAKATGDPNPLAVQLAKALAAKHLTPGQRAAVAGVRSQLAGSPPSLEAIALFELFRANGVSEAFRRRAVGGAPELRPTFAALLDERQVTPTERAAMLAAFDTAIDAPNATNVALGRNIERIAAVCQQHGTELVLLTYPLEHGEVASVMRTMGKQLGVDVVDVLERFAALNQGAAFDALFVLDGHCNDAGYRLMGEIVAAHARARLR